MSVPNRIRFWMAFPGLISHVPEFWRCLTKHLADSKALPKTFFLQQITGHPEELQSEKRLILTPHEVEDIIAKRKLTGFHVDTGHSNRSIDFQLRGNWDGKDPRIQATSFSCRIESQTKAPDDWAPLIGQLLSRWSSIGAWQYLLPYQAWQWDMIVSEHYERRWGVLPPGYTTYLDPNFDGRTAITKRRTFIDTSMNPGRPKKLLSGVNFYPTAEMWLGPDFLQYAKCTKEEALAADFFIAKRDTPDYLYLKCWPHPFTRPDGEQGLMQQRLWKLFFHEDCEWPPGSGTICDEPMYGPLELMPKSE